MLKIEKKLFDLVDKYRLVLSLLLVMALTLWLRKIGVWWNYANVAASFDMHPNYTESSLYHLLVRGMQYLPLLPLHSVKWLAGLCDYVLVLFCVYSTGATLKQWREREIISYIILIFSPVLYIRGIIWGQIDSVSMMFLVLSYLLWEKKKILPAMVSAILACALYPCLLPVVIVYFYIVDKERSLFYVVWIIFDTAFLLGIAALALGYGFLEGVETMLRWATYHVLDGSLFMFSGDWLMQLVIFYGLPVSIFCVIGTLRGKLSYKWTIFAQVLVTIFYGSSIFLEKLY